MTSTADLRLPSPMRLAALQSFPENVTVEEIRAMVAWIHQQLEARARSTDPDTSHEAARSIGEMTGKRQAVLDIIRAIGRGTDEDFVDAYHATTAPQQSASGIRTRRAELTLMGLVVDTGERKVRRSGRGAIVWGIA